MYGVYINMNIFVLDIDPWKIPAHYCDLHVNKMLLETAQLLCSVFPEGEAPYKRTHYNHPCAIWARESFANYRWLIKLGAALCKEFTRRTGKVHKSQTVIQWCDQQTRYDTTQDILTPWPQVMPDEFKDYSYLTIGSCYERHGSNDGLAARSTRQDVINQKVTIKAYRRYYAAKLREFRKRGICKFTRR